MKRLELVARSSVAVGLVAYFVGFLIVNMHLANRGVFYAEMFRTEYVAAGLLWLLLMAIPTGLIFFLVLRISELLPPQNRAASSAPSLLQRLKWLWRYEEAARRSIIEMAFITWGTLVAIDIVVTMLDATGAGLDASGAPLVLLVCLTAIAIFFALTAFVSHYEESWRPLALWRRNGDDRFRIRRLFLATNAIVYLVVLMWVYATFAYPRFYRTVGGGYRPAVNMFVSRDMESILRFAHFPVTDGRILVPVSIILETSARTVIARLDEETEAISIPTASVTGVLYCGPKTLVEARKGVRHPFRTWWDYVSKGIRAFLRRNG